MKQKLVCLDVKRGCFSNINEHNAKHICSLLFCKYTLHFASVNPLFSILNHTYWLDVLLESLICFFLLL